MFKKNKNNSEDDPKINLDFVKEKKPKYNKPKIILIDIDTEVSKILQDWGFNAVSGSFGSPYKVIQASSFNPVIGIWSLPNYNEQEIIIIDVSQPTIKDNPEGNKFLPKEEFDWWAKCDKGFIDPRPRSMNSLRNSFNRILENGGIFIVFADCRLHQNFLYAKSTEYGLENQQTIYEDNWSFLSIFSRLNIKYDEGNEIIVKTKMSPISEILDKYINGASYSCILEPQYSKEWDILAVNKFDNPVALTHYNPTSKAFILLLPRIKDKKNIILELCKNILPEKFPHLFPEFTIGKWIHRPEYELQKILELKNRITTIEKDTSNKVEELLKKIESEESSNRWIYDLVAETDKKLVDSVKKAFELFGFKQVIDVDEERDKKGLKRREDLQILDKSPILIIDIKGISGNPSDSDIQQAHKHATIRIKEWKKSDVQSLTIINHQRQIPPLDRENKIPFRNEILQFAEEIEMGLLTTWDLFRLVRSFQKWKWKEDFVKPLFYKTSRFEIVPLHYEYLGRVIQIWTGVIGIEIESGELKIHDRIALELVNEFEEQTVKSLQIDKVPIEVAIIGNKVGIQTLIKKPFIREGIRIFKVVPPEEFLINN